MIDLPFSVMLKETSLLTSGFGSTFSICIVDQPQQHPGLGLCRAFFLGING